MLKLMLQRQQLKQLRLRPRRSAQRLKPLQRMPALPQQRKLRLRKKPRRLKLLLLPPLLRLPSKMLRPIRLRLRPSRSARKPMLLKLKP